MKNSIFLVLIGISLLFALVGFILKVLGLTEQSADIYIDAGLSFANLIGLIMLLYNGTIFKTAYFLVIIFWFCIAVIGVVFKFMHWPAANLLVLVSVLGILLTYTVRFFKKQEKQRLDVLKLLWVITFLLGALGVILKWLPKEITYVSTVVFWFTLADLLVSISRKKHSAETKVS